MFITLLKFDIEWWFMGRRDKIQNTVLEFDFEQRFIIIAYYIIVKIGRLEKFF